MYKTASRNRQRRVEKAQKPRRGLKSGRSKPGILIGSHAEREDRGRKRQRLKILRERWAPYLSDCLQTGITPVAVPKEIEMEIERAGSLRGWLQLHAAVPPG